MTARNHLIRPEKNFEQIELAQERLSAPERCVITDRAARFAHDRFKTMTSREQSELLAQVDVHLLKQKAFDPSHPPFQFEVIRDRMGLRDNQRITERVATDFYLDYSDTGRRMWLNRALQDPAAKALVQEKIFEKLATQLPSVVYTLAHIYEGGHYGLLTARGARDNHVRQMGVISENFGFAPQVELVYYVNDEKLAKRLYGNSADKKATVLVNFANGLKEDESGNLVPMTVGKPFDEIIFTDDEDKNLKAVMYCLVRDVCSNVLYEAGVRHRTQGIEERISDRAKKITDDGYKKHGVAATHDFKFWLGVVDGLLNEFTKQSGKLSDRASLISGLMATRKWLPDIVKVLDGRNIPVEQSIERLRKALSSEEPLHVGSKNSVVFDDIDGNLLSVNARFYVTSSTQPDRGRLLVLDQAQFAEHPTADYWIAEASKASGIPASELSFSFEHFRDPEAIEQDILRAMHKGKILENPYDDHAH